MSALAGFEFADPAWLWAALLGPLVVLASIWRSREGRSVTYPGADRLQVGARGWRARVHTLPLVAAALGLVTAAVAQARPQLASVRENVITQGVDIVVALDVSGSMAAEDFQPKNRIEVAKEVVSEFVQKRPHDRVGLVIFAGRSLTKVPPTTDTGVLLRQLDDVELGTMPDGTAIGSGLATALTRLRRSQAKSKVIVLVTDGVNNAGEIDPATASDIARALNVRVYTIAVGRGGLVPMPVEMRDPLSGRTVKTRTNVQMDVDEDLLKKIAAQTGGEEFRATDSSSLRTIFDRIDHLEKSEMQHTEFKRYHELFPPVLAAAAVLLATAGLLWLAGVRVVPA